ncbi:hypothetical protein ZOSMA_174G00280 [Zostera marina]|uniref:Uncharacterized protein n=1 Tax=Zostera marina TaxID=29655 RepID=A0A0K9PUA2_ZOSMR|nr:hypothetical protein ZOSMA_174G00280 [Zostera marina]
MGTSFELGDGRNGDRQSNSTDIVVDIAGGNSDRSCVPTGRDEYGSQTIQAKKNREMLQRRRNDHQKMDPGAGDVIKDLKT